MWKAQHWVYFWKSWCQHYRCAMCTPRLALESFVTNLCAAASVARRYTVCLHQGETICKLLREKTSTERNISCDMESKDVLAKVKNIRARELVIQSISKYSEFDSRDPAACNSTSRGIWNPLWPPQATALKFTNILPPHTYTHTHLHKHACVKA